MDAEDKIKHLTSLVEASLLPELRYELGCHYMDAQHFNSFRQDLDINLIQIFDLVQQNEHLFNDKEGNTRQLRFKFILLLCEQSAPDTHFQSRNNVFLKNIHILMEKHVEKMLMVDEQLLKLIFDYYKERLHESCWKKNLSSIHGFDMFSQVYCKNHKLSKDICTFVLSVSLLLEDFYEPSYKEIGFRFINLILNKTPKIVLTELNIHHGVYETLFRNIQKVSTVSGAVHLWECLYKCIEIVNIRDYSKWNKLDDIFEAIIHRITFESDTNICIYLFTILPKLCLINVPNNFDMIELLNVNNNSIEFEGNLRKLRDMSKTIQPKVFYRWVKSLLNLLIAESHRLINESVAIKLLKAYHICYIICVSTIPFKVCEPHLIVFLEKFTPVIMEVVANHWKKEEIVLSVRQILETILTHLDNESLRPLMSNKVSLYKENLSRLLESGVLA